MKRDIEAKGFIYDGRDRGPQIKHDNTGSHPCKERSTVANAIQNKETVHRDGFLYHPGLGDSQRQNEPLDGNGRVIGHRFGTTVTDRLSSILAKLKSRLF